MPPLLAIAIVMTFSQFLLQTFGCLFVGNFELGFDPEIGTFGYFNGEYAFYVIFGIGLIGGALYYCCVAMALKYFSALVLCSSLLFQPFVAQAIGCIMGIDQLPGACTYIGTVVTLFGFYFVSKGGEELKKKYTKMDSL